MQPADLHETYMIICFVKYTCIHTQTYTRAHGRSPDFTPRIHAGYQVPVDCPVGLL